MKLVEKIQGNQHDPDWQDRLSDARVDHLKLDQWDAQKNRFRKKTVSGTELAVSLERGTFLRNGDVLDWDSEEKVAIVADIALKDVLVVETSALLDQSPEVMLRTAVELGHALGNQHWPAVIKGTKVYVPMAVDRKVMSSVMKTHALEGITYEFTTGESVIPYLAPHETRRLFGGAESPLHGHSHSHSHSH